MLMTPRRALGHRIVSLLLASFVGVGCSALTDVSAPDLVERPALENTNGAIALYNGAIAAFNRTFGGIASNTGPYVTASGMLSDELIATSSFSGVIEIDQRTLPNSSFNIYLYLQLTRRDALQARLVVDRVMPTQRWRTGHLYSVLGYVDVLLAEIMCSGVPLSSMDGNYSPVFGPGLTTTKLLEHAVAMFDSALLFSSDSVRLMNVARVGRGRALLDLGRTSEAATAVTDVPTSFSFVSEHSAAVNANYVYQHIASLKFAGVANVEGGNGLDYIASTDPRVAAVSLGAGYDGTSPLYRPAKLTSPASPNVVGSGIEARLIEAEALLKAGSAEWLTRLNALRATAISPALPALSDPGMADARVSLLFRERAFWLFLTGHRLGDMRRLVTQYGRQAQAVFAQGTHRYGGTFGAFYSLPIDQSEIDGNPLMNGTGCIDRLP